MEPKGSVINEICSLYDQLSGGEQAIADFVMAHPSDIASMTTREIAQASATSAASVSRFARRLGYESLSALRGALLRDERAYDEQGGLSVISMDSPKAALETVLMVKNRELTDTLSLLKEDEVVRAVHLLERSVSITFAAVGNTIPSALSASFLMGQLGLRCNCAPTTEAMMLNSLSLTPRDVIVFLSKSGHSQRLNKMMDNAIDSDTPTIVITNQLGSPLARRATCVLHAATHDKMLSPDMPFSHNSINYIIEVLFLLLSSDIPNFRAHAGLLWKALGEDKGVPGEVF